MALTNNDIKIVSNSFQPQADTYNKFNRFRIPSGEPFISNVAYIFFTRPDLNFSPENFNNSQFLSVLNSDNLGRKILSSLSTSYQGQGQNINGPFIKLLSNTVTNFETKDTSLKTLENHENWFGLKMVSPYNYFDQIGSDGVTFSFEEYEDLRVTTLIKTWVEYMAGVKSGLFTPSERNRSEKIFDYMSSIYYFLTGVDGHTIKYFTKLTGCYPVNIPYSSFSWEKGGSTELRKLSVTFNYQIKEDMEPEILQDFLDISGIYKSYDNNEGTGQISEDTIDENWSSGVTITNNEQNMLGLYFTK